MKYLHPKKWIRISKTAIKDFWNYYCLPDKVYLKKQYKKKFGKSLDLKNPKTFSEKIQWLKLYDRNQNYHKMVDKYEAKKYVSNIIGDEFIIPTLGVWDKFDEIDFDKLPEQFVLKCNHDSASVMICTDKNKFDFKKARKKLTEALKVDYYHFENLQWAYKGIKPRIIAEKYMIDKSGAELKDYKFYCFNGNVKLCQIIANRFSQETIDFFDTNWNHIEGLVGLNLKTINSPIKHERPLHYNEMINIAQKLSKSIPYSRIDLYYIDKKIYFGEITLYPAGGFGSFKPDKWNNIIGDWIILPKINS